MTSQGNILQVSHLSKDFGGLHALVDITFDLPEGQILGLIGPNGAGKTTLFNIINGIYPADEGTVIFRQEDVTRMKPYHLARRGLARTHQIVRPLSDLTVRENVMVGACFGRQAHSLRTSTKIANEVLEFVGLASRADQLAGHLNVGQKKRLELVRALAAQPYLLLLDEVLAGLNSAEITPMAETIQEIRKQGITIIMIEHVMRAVMGVSDRVIVLNQGQQIAEGTPQEIAANPHVIEAYLGDARLAEQLSQVQER